MIITYIGSALQIIFFFAVLFTIFGHITLLDKNLDGKELTKNTYYSSLMFYSFHTGLQEDFQISGYVTRYLTLFEIMCSAIFHLVILAMVVSKIKK